MKISEKIKANATKFIFKVNPYGWLRSLKAHIQQLENNKSLLKQALEYKTQEIKNNTVIQALYIRSLLKNNQVNVAHDSVMRSNYKPARPKPYSEYLEKLRSIDPVVFKEWEQCFNHGMISYMEEREHSCSTWSNEYARAFKYFISVHASGRLLDQGCGIYGVPYYLEDYPVDLISAIEPLEPVVESGFEIVRGFSEFLPWPDASFKTIVNGTSLDHVLCLDTAISETHRVLQNDGSFLVWIASIKGASIYNPSVKPIKPVDKFHLFHFHESWFEDAMKEKFYIYDKLVFPTPSFDHIFYNFKKKVTSSEGTTN